MCEQRCFGRCAQASVCGTWWHGCEHRGRDWFKGQPPVTSASASMRRFICVAVCCSVLQCVAVFFSVTFASASTRRFICAVVCCSVLQCVAVCRRVDEGASYVSYQVPMCGMTFVRRFICVAVCCVLQRVATHSSAPLRQCRYVRYRLVEGTFVLCSTCV